MSFLNANLVDLVGLILGFLLTLFVFSYVWGDNALFRLVIHIFIGVTAGYVTIIAINNVILPHLLFPLLSGEQSELYLAVLYLIPSGLLLTKLSPRLAQLGNPSMAILVGIGAAAAIGGSIMGTLFPQVSASINLFDSLYTQGGNASAWQQMGNALLILLGTLSSLIYFHFGTRSGPDKSSQRVDWIKGIGWIGQIFIAITFGALFTGVYIAALSALIERIAFLWSIFPDFLLPLLIPA
jgi:hypothetical protein